jgi:hypothetical protein
VDSAVGSNRVSGSFLCKLGILPTTCRDFRDGRPKEYQIQDTEILRLNQQARQRRAFERLSNEVRRDRIGWLVTSDSNR